MGRSSSWVVVLIAAIAGSSGCARTFKGEATQPNPLAQPTETLRESEPIVIVTGDKDLYAPQETNGPMGSPGNLLRMQRYPLRNVARFSVVTRDRLRFHVQIEHKWKDYVDVRNWHAYLVDDRGRRYEPVDVDQSRHKHVVMTWDYHTQSRGVTRNQFNDVVYVDPRAPRDHQTLGNLSVFRGFGDFVFYSKDIFREDIRTLTFVLERSDLRFRFTWRFTEDALGEIDEGVAVR